MNSIEQSPSKKPNGSSASQEITGILCNAEIHHYAHESPQPMFPPQCERPSFTPTQKIGIIAISCSLISVFLNIRIAV